MKALVLILVGLCTSIVALGQDISKVGLNRFIHAVGTQNTSIGLSAGAALTTGSSVTANTFMGFSAGFSTINGYGNSFVGSQAGYSNISGNSNTFNGYLSGFGNTSGTANAFVGSLAGYKNTTGFYDTFIGTSAGYSNTTGSQNTFIGLSAGYYSLTGGNNTFIGAGAGENNNSGADNVFLGFRSGYTNSSGFANIALGSNSGGGNGQYNIAIGQYSGSGGTKNIYLGYQAQATGPNSTSLSNAVAIGTNARVAINDAIVLGDTANTNIKVGIGTASPRYPLDVKGTINIRLPGTLKFANRAFLQGDEQDFIVLKGGQMGESGLKLANLTNQVASVKKSSRFLSVDEQGRVALYQPTLLANQVILQVNQPNQWADDVFSSTYSLRTINQLKEYIRINGHLPGFPSAGEMVRKGASVESLIVNLVKTQEEQSQYLIQLKAENEQLRQLLNKLLQDKKDH